MYVYFFIMFTIITFIVCCFVDNIYIIYLLFLLSYITTAVFIVLLSYCHGSIICFDFYYNYHYYFQLFTMLWKEMLELLFTLTD